MGDRTRAKSLWIYPESTFNTDPSASGALYVPLPAVEIGFREDNTQQQTTDYFTNRPWGTLPVNGPMRWSLPFTVPIFGYTPCADDGQAVAAADVLDGIFSNAFGTADTGVGEGASAGSTTTITLDTSILALGDLIPIYDSAWTSALRTQWAYVTGIGSAPQYSIAPTLDEAPAGTSEQKGWRAYGVTRTTTTTNTSALVLQEDSKETVFTGGKVTSLKISAGPGEMYKMAVGMSGVTFATSAKGSLPAATTGPAVTPLKNMLSPVWFNNTKIPVRSVEIDFGMQASLIEHGQNSEAAAGYEIVRWDPKITIEPLVSADYRAMFYNPEAATSYGRLLIQMGAGVLSSDVLNTMAFAANRAYVSGISDEDENGRHRQKLTLSLADSEITTGTAAELFRIARA